MTGKQAGRPTQQPWMAREKVEARTFVVTEGAGDVTALVGPVSNRGSPSLGVGVSGLNVVGDLVASEPPERDLSLVPEHNDDTTVGLVERITSASVNVVDTTTGVSAVGALALETERTS